jgi:protein-S-isoprenylcysteine O-methyltransferase Ste14
MDDHKRHPSRLSTLVIVAALGLIFFGGSLMFGLAGGAWMQGGEFAVITLVNLIVVIGWKLSEYWRDFLETITADGEPQESNSLVTTQDARINSD